MAAIPGKRPTVSAVFDDPKYYERLYRRTRNRAARWKAAAKEMRRQRDIADADADQWCSLYLKVQARYDRDVQGYQPRYSSAHPEPPQGGTGLLRPRERS